MTLDRSSLLLTGFATLVLASALAAPSVKAAAFPLKCEVDRDEGAGQIRVRNTGTLAVPVTSIVTWSASTGVGGTFRLVDSLGPGERTFEFNGETLHLRMGIDTCTAMVTWHPPLPLGSKNVGDALDLTKPEIKVLDPNKMNPCDYCDESIPSQSGAIIVPEPQQGGGAMAVVTGDVDIYDVPDGVGTVIGMLRQGDSVPLIECREDQWCQIQQPQGAAWVWGEYLQH